MKAKYVLLSLLCISICSTAQAQFLKKLKKKAEQAAERTILNKTDEVVTETTEKTIDGATTGDNNNSENPNTEDTTNTTTQTSQTGPAMNPMMSKRMDTSKIPETYEFDWEFKTEMTSAKGDKIQMNYFLNSNSSDYAGMEMSTKDTKQQGNMMMVMDSKSEAMVMFMEASGQKMAQLHKIPESKSKAKDDEFTFKEIGTKTILGYECFGIEVENKGTKATMYYTLDAPVTFSAFFNFANNKAPKGFDPALLEVMKEDALLMEMHAFDKKKSDESYDLTAISLNKKDTNIKKSDYQFMGF